MTNKAINIVDGRKRHVDPELVADEIAHFDVEHPAVMRQRHVHVGARPVQRGHQRRGNVGQPPGFGAEGVGEVAHAFGEIHNIAGR